MRSTLRERIADAYRRPEADCMAALIGDAGVSGEERARIDGIARKIVTAVRAKKESIGIGQLMHEYSLSSDEGVALMCLAEALLRVPDDATRDALIRDKVTGREWASHFGRHKSMFVNAATWGFVVAGRVLGGRRDEELAEALTGVLRRGGETVIRNAVDIAIRVLARQFVAAEDIEQALARARRQHAHGFRHSFDMLGEGAVTAADADRYFAEYQRAAEAIGRAAAGMDLYEAPGLSIKLSALHPRYERSKARRLAGELMPKVRRLALIAKAHGIGINIDAEEADRLELSLDVLEGLCRDADLRGWNGIGFVIQAYGKRTPLVIDYLADLAGRTAHRLMVRLVKGAYWDTEIKRAQQLGLRDYPVFTRKVHTDVSYLAAARRLLARPDAFYPQFATHNAATVAAIFEMARPAAFHQGQYEFQCLHGMGEGLYEEVIGRDKLDRPCRIYAPVGSPETLLPYLVRRLLENGANSSFVNQIADERVSVAALVADPAEAARKIASFGSPHPAIPLPRDMLDWQNSEGLDLSDERELAKIGAGVAASRKRAWIAAPPGDRPAAAGHGGQQPVTNPADHRDVVGFVTYARPEDIDRAFARAKAGLAGWSGLAPAGRAAILRAGADALQRSMHALIGLIIREAGKSAGNAVGEVREAADFLRYYAARIEADFANATHRPLGVVVSISPWNFPLAIFTGQLAAGLAAGNAVIVKPAEETPLIAAEAVRLLHGAGVPEDALQLLPGDGPVGAALVRHGGAAGVLFTGSTEVARLIRADLANRGSIRGTPIPLIAETGGLNAMIVDSSALLEQVTGDAVTSAFDSAGQRCSALRLLCLQEDIADRALAMIRGAMAELAVGDPSDLTTDVGPVITARAADDIAAYVAGRAGYPVHAVPLPRGLNGTFIPPTLIEVPAVAAVTREVFGPVLHVVRFRRKEMKSVVGQVNALGYGLTFGVHSRVDQAIEALTAAADAGNIYVNRNMIGAVVGVQPFGGHALSGTGPKAGGPLYLRRLTVAPPLAAFPGPPPQPPAALSAYVGWLRSHGLGEAAGRAARYGEATPLGRSFLLRGPVGESNTYATRSAGEVLLLPETRDGLLIQIGAVLATGNTAVVCVPADLEKVLADLPEEVRGSLSVVAEWRGRAGLAAILAEGDPDRIRAIDAASSRLDGPLVLVQGASAAGLADGGEDYLLDGLVREVALSENTAARGGDARLLAMMSA